MDDINYFNDLKHYELQDLVGKELKIEKFEDWHEAQCVIYAKDMNDETIYVLDIFSMI